MSLVPIPEPFQDPYRILHAGLLHHDWLEAPFKGSVLLDIFSVFIDRRGTDHLELAPRKAGFEDVGGIDRSFRSPGPYDGVNFVDEKDYIPAITEFLDEFAHPLLELAPVLGARDEVTHVKLHYSLALQYLGDIAGNNLLGQALHDRRLADAGVSYQHRVILGPPREDLDEPLDLLGPADDGIEFVSLGHLRQGYPQLVQRRRLRAAR